MPNLQCTVQFLHPSLSKERIGDSAYRCTWRSFAQSSVAQKTWYTHPCACPPCTSTRLISSPVVALFQPLWMIPAESIVVACPAPCLCSASCLHKQRLHAPLILIIFANYRGHTDFAKSRLRIRSIGLKRSIRRPEISALTPQRVPQRKGEADRSIVAARLLGGEGIGP